MKQATVRGSIAVLKNSLPRKVFLSTTVVGGAVLCLLYTNTWLASVTSVTITNNATTSSHTANNDVPNTATPPPPPTWPAVLDTQAYDARMLALSGYTSSTLAETITVGSTTRDKYHIIKSSSTSARIEGRAWPATTPYPYGGALLPFHRIVAYYGNFYSRHMGILGELSHDELIDHLNKSVAAWEAADPTTPALPAIHYIAMVAQGSAGVDGTYRAVMPKEQIEKAQALSLEVNGLLFLDLQVGLSTLPQELPKFREYLKQPNTHLGIDPEFSMKGGQPPGTVIGTYDASDINYAINWLADIVNENQLPPKILVVHRFTQDMLTNYKNIKQRPEVQVVIDMDGWGSKELKRATYEHVIVAEPVAFSGLKLFYKNDLKPPSNGLYTPEEVLRFTPKPIYIQYQ